MKFPIQKSKKAVVCIFLIFRFSFPFFKVLLPSLNMSTVKQFLGDFFEKIFCFIFKESTLQCLKKIQIQRIVFNKKALVKISRISNSKIPPENLEY